MSDVVLKVDSVCKKIKRREVIKNISFTVNKGDICGFIGPNGAGKTTLIRLITGLIKKDKGNIFLNGYDVYKDRRDALVNLGVIVQEPIFFPYLTGEKALLNLALLNENMTKKERKDKVLEVLKIVGLYDRRKDKVSTYSLGMKQRLGIAQALLNNPKIIILDEPANGLDPMGMIELRELILKLNKENGITFFISSHLLDELQKICNKLVVIRTGEVIWSGDTETLLNETKGKTLEETFVSLIKRRETY